MKLHDFLLLTAENIDPGVVDFFRQHGFDVWDVKASGFQGSSDEDLVEKAFLENRVIVTEDNDFGEIVFKKRRDFIGVIHLKPGSFFLQFHVQTLSAIVKADPDIDPPFFLSAENKNGRVRIRVRNALPGPSPAI